MKRVDFMLEYLKLEKFSFSYVPQILEIKVEENRATLINCYKEKRLTESQSKELLEKLESFQISSWKRHYELQDLQVLDGEKWELNYKEVEKSNIRIKGNNAYPEVWENLLKVLEECFEI